MVGTIVYNVYVTCPKCNERIDVAGEPYDDRGEDELGMAVFGTPFNPANWENPRINYTCELCGGAIEITELRI